jgi:hypothetical protein
MANEKPYLCEHDVSSLVGGESPLAKVLFIAYDDGPTSGAAQCRVSSESYRFELLARDIDGKYDAEAWERGEEIRIFSLASLPLGSFQQLDRILSDPASLRKLEEDQAFYDQVNGVLAESSPPEFVIATYGIKTKIIAARHLSATDLANTKDWFAFLGLEG